MPIISPKNWQLITKANPTLHARQVKSVGMQGREGSLNCMGPREASKAKRARLAASVLFQGPSNQKTKTSRLAKTTTSMTNVPG